MANNILKDNTNKALFSMSVPISIGMLSTFLFQVIDTYFVGQLGPEALAALSFSSTIYFLLVGLFMGLSVGVSIIIGKATGSKAHDKVKQTTWVALILCFTLSSLLASMGIIFVEIIFQSLGAENIIIPLIEKYMIPLFAGIPLLATGIMAGGILRATGNVTMPEVMMGIAGIINLIFDYLLIFGKMGFPEMGIQGAAYATVLSWIFVIVGMSILLIKDKLLFFQKSPLSNVLSILQEIYKLGLPTIVTQIIGPFTLMYLTYLLAKQSSLAVAAFGVASRIETLLMIGILGVSTAITPFIAQNLGAKEHLRIDEAIAFGGRASTYMGILVCIILYLFIKPIAGIFSEDEMVIDYTARYFYLVSLSYVFYGLFVITSSIFNGLQLPVNSLKIMVIKSLLFTFPLTLLGSFWGVEGIFIGLSVSNLLAGLYSAIQMRKQFKKVNSNLANISVMNEYKNDLIQAFNFISKPFR
ncbi:MATE family efflux transporter [Fulvivirgaceae bacterium BMA10]|uniref:MATE family efflux transporter n=1 Tax=Splendidivirga corallicola TaxID=3051826 RepID=A0ABT8KX13_9BACT|nr:MATE family efflux transporter [Fulvivirgaceae bacterium BMA10]